MFARYLQAAITAVVAVLVAAILTFIIGFFMPYFGPEDSLFRQTFAALNEWVLFIMLVAVAFGVIVRSVVEGGGQVR